MIAEPKVEVQEDVLLKFKRAAFKQMLELIKTAKTGHLGACCSSLDLMIALYFGGVLRYDTSNPKHPHRDYVLNRGHLGPLKYTIFAMLGWLEREELNFYREYGSRLVGHEDMDITPGVDLTPSGSLGMMLSYAVGAAVGFRDKNMPNRLWCFLGDGEEEEGNVSEAARHAAHLGLQNIVVVIDKNGGQLSTRLKETDSTNLVNLWKSYGWNTIRVDGHDLDKIIGSYQSATMLHGPVCIIADTVKGNGIPGCEDDYCGYHVFHGSEPGETIRHIDIESVIDSMEEEEWPKIESMTLPAAEEINGEQVPEISVTKFAEETSIYDVEKAFMTELKKEIGNRLYILTSDYPPRCFVYEGHRELVQDKNYYNVGLREQHMTAMAHGLVKVRPDAVVFILCGDAFLYRHMDQINVLAQAKSRVIFYSVQAGLSGAKNGTTHQSSGQSGAILTMPGISLEEPCSPANFIDASNRAMQRNGPTCIRLQKLESEWDLNPVHVAAHGGFEVLRYNKEAVGTIFVSGMTTVEALKSELADWNLINLVTLSNLAGLSEWTIDKPALAYYNGNRLTIEMVLLSNLHNSGWRGTLTAHGFDFGVTGDMSQLMKHFGMDRGSISEDAKLITQPL